MFVYVADKTIVPLKGASNYINATFINVSVITLRLTFHGPKQKFGHF